MTRRYIHEEGKIHVEDSPLTYTEERERLKVINAALLEALEAMLAYEDDEPIPGTFGAEVYDKARAAIAQARGEAGDSRRAEGGRR